MITTVQKVASVFSLKDTFNIIASISLLLLFCHAIPNEIFYDRLPVFVSPFYSLKRFSTYRPRKRETGVSDIRDKHFPAKRRGRAKIGELQTRATRVSFFFSFSFHWPRLIATLSNSQRNSGSRQNNSESSVLPCSVLPNKQKISILYRHFRAFRLLPVRLADTWLDYSREFRDRNAAQNPFSYLRLLNFQQKFYWPLVYAFPTKQQVAYVLQKCSVLALFHFHMHEEPWERARFNRERRRVENSRWCRDSVKFSTRENGTKRKCVADGRKFRWNNFYYRSRRTSGGCRLIFLERELQLRCIRTNFLNE